MSETTLRVTDMSCAHCEMSVQEAVGALDGVEAVTADHAAGEVRVSHDPALAPEERLAAAVRDAGYTPAS